MLKRVLLIGSVIAGCTSAAGRVDDRSPELVAERIRTRIEAAGIVMELRAAGEPVYASLVLPSFYERRLYRPAWSDARGPTRLADDLIDALRRADLEGAAIGGLPFGRHRGSPRGSPRRCQARPGISPRPMGRARSPADGRIPRLRGPSPGGARESRNAASGMGVEPAHG